MKKRLLAMVLALVLVFSLLPGVVIAEGEEHVHCLCGVNTEKGTVCEECDSEAVVWTGTNKLPTTNGNYYLTESISDEKAVINGTHVSLCLHGKTVTSKTGIKLAYVAGGGSLKLTDCSENPGTLTGVTSEPVVQVARGSVFNMYGGKISGNTASNVEGVVKMDYGTASVNGGTFNMYGGEISGNTVKRGTIYAALKTGVKPCIIRILGGTITGNHAAGTGTAGGGAGVIGMYDVEIGGNAKIYGNTSATSPADVYIREDQGAHLVISSEVPLTGDAKVNAGFYKDPANPVDLTNITGSPASWNPNWLTLDGERVCYADGKFYLESGYANAHIHCLCGAETAVGATCEKCGSKTVVWSGVTALPTAEGYYYLTADISATPLIPANNAHVAICLHGHTVTSKAGKKIAYLQKGGILTITDCAENPGTLTGVVNEPVIQASAGTTLNLYGGKISGNTNTGDATIQVSKGNATTIGATFNMYGGEISGNTVNRGTIMTGIPTGSEQNPVVRILGGIITGNHATGKTGTNGYGGAGVVAMVPVEVGGDAKIYGNTAAMGPADLFIRNDQRGELIISDEKPLSGDAQINVGLYTPETEVSDLVFVSGTPSNWNNEWITYEGEKLRYEEGKFTIEKILIYSDHSHDGKNWISVTNDNEMLPELSGHYVLDEDVTLPREMQIAEGQTVVLCLNGHTLKAAAGARHFTIFGGGELTICDCTAKTVDGVYTAGQITGAENAQYGAAIRVRPGGVCNLRDGKITGNHTTLEGGAFYLVACSGSDTTPAVLNMYGGEISHNSADKGYGGAIRFAGAAAGFKAATFRMEGGVISNNSVPNYGGAFHAPSYATVELLGGVIENNTSGAGGGGVSINGLTTLVIDGTVIRGNTAAKWGGGVYAKAGATVEFIGGEISGNEAKAGAGILIEGAGTTLNMTGGKIKENKVGVAHGGGVHAAKGTVFNLAGGEICSNTAEGGGAGVAVVGATVNMTGGNICHNESKSWGAGMLLSVDGVFVMDGGKITQNYTHKSAAGIYAVRCKMILNKGSIHDNIAQNEAGGIRMEGATLELNGAWITSNRTIEGNGGGIFARSTRYKVDGKSVEQPSHIVMNGGSVSYNYSAKAGSGVLIQSEGTTFTMYGGKISHNTAYKFAGAVYAGTGSDFTMHGGEVCYNTMETDGVAGVYHDGGSGHHTGGEIHHNTTPVSGGGFGVSRDGCVVYAKNLKIYENSAKAAAGVLLSNRAKLYMEDCEIYNNTASYVGGGVYQYTYVDLYMKNCTVRDNVAAQDGGAFWSWAISNATFENCLIENNKAEKGQGGAVWTRGDSLTMIDCTVKNNTAPGNGGAFYFGAMGAATDDWTPGFHIENTVIANNTSGGQGGGLFMANGSHGNLVNLTVTGNQAAAEGGAFWARETVEIHGGIYTGNTSGGEGYAVYLADSDFDGHSFFNGKFRMSGDLQIVDNQGGDLYLGKKVPVIFSGDGLGQNAKIHVNMHAGLLTQWVWGSYNYEGGNCDYIITYGDRSVTDPEYADPNEEMPQQTPSEEPTESVDPTEAPTEGEQEQPKGNTGLIVGIGAVVAVIAAAAVIIVLAAKKKKGAK